MRFAKPTFLAALATLTVLMASAGRARSPELPKGLEKFTLSAPPLEFNDSSRKPHQLAEYKGRPLVVHFWATWCEPCRRELPAMAAAFRGSEAAFLPISIDEKASDAELLKFVQGVPTEIPVFRVTSLESSRKYWAWGLPVTYFFDSAGKLQARAMGSLDWPALSKTALPKYLHELGAAQNR